MRFRIPCFELALAADSKPADGKTVDLAVSSTSGNFYYDGRLGRLTFPYTASVRWNGLERKMMAEQTNGDCNECHTQYGDNGAPGRIILP